MNHRTYTTTLFSVLLFVGLLAAPATAQEASAPDAVPERSWATHFGAQARTLLETGDTERQEKTMQLILQFAGTPSADVNFAPAVPALFDVYENAEDEGLRLMALASLKAVGSEPDFQRLAESVRFETSDRVRKQALRVLTVHRQESPLPSDQ